MCKIKPLNAWQLGKKLPEKSQSSWFLSFSFFSFRNIILSLQIIRLYWGKNNMQYWFHWPNLRKNAPKTSTSDETHYHVPSSGYERHLSVSKNGHKQTLALCQGPALHHSLNDELFCFASLSWHFPPLHSAISLATSSLELFLTASTARKLVLWLLQIVWCGIVGHGWGWE